MISPDKLFGNFFNDIEITPARLANFSNDHLNRLTAANTNDRFTPLINRLTPPLKALQDQLGNVDTSLTKQKGATLTNDQLLADFKKTMSNYEGVIANAVGGFDSPGYLQFYPHKLSEYTKATKTQMPVLVKRIASAAVAFAARLGEPLATNLQNFEKNWDNSRTAQEQQIGSVTGNRTERTTAETDTQIALLENIHSIALMFPGDVAQCTSFFDFSLLYPKAHKQPAQIINGTVAKKQTTAALNRSFTDKVEMKLTTQSDNASLLAFLGATADAQPNGNGIEVNAGKSRNLKLSELGNANGTFLLIKNLSDVNDAAYSLEIKG